jgi:hypothetical protein
MNNNTDRQVANFLKSIDYEKRYKENNRFTNSEIAIIMLEQLGYYEAGKVSVEFIAEIAKILQDEAMYGANPEYNAELTGVLCSLDDLRYAISRTVDKSVKSLKRLVE